MSVSLMQNRWNLWYEEMVQYASFSKKVMKDEESYEKVEIH